MNSNFVKKFRRVIASVKSKKNSLHNHKLFGLLIGLASIGVISLMTGLLYFKNEACIYDGEEALRVFTMHDDVYDILEEQNIAIGEYDRVECDGITDGEAIITIYRSIDMPIYADGDTHIVECAYDETVEAVVERSGLEINEFDCIFPSEDTICSETSAIDILRGYTAYVNVDGETLQVTTANQTVSEFLERAGVILKEDDYTDVPLDSIVIEGETVTVTRVRYVEIETTEIIPYETKTITSNLVSMYTSEITVEGENGQRVNTSRVKYVNNVRVSETAVSSEIVLEPVTKVISKGTALMTPYSKRDSENLILVNGLPAEYEYVLTGKSTAYTARAGSGTASGRTLEIGTVAVDPEIIPYGSELYIVSADGSYVYGYAIAADTGDLTAHEVLVDLYMGLMEEAYDYSCWYGARTVNVYVLS